MTTKELNPIPEGYIRYLSEVRSEMALQNRSLDELIDKIRNSGAVHLYGFGRSGAAALSLAIRLRHFSGYLPPVWWVGDQVRQPIRHGDLVILFSKTGTREEVLAVAKKTRPEFIAVITAREGTTLWKDAGLRILLPALEETFVYGGGDFELASYFFQEVLVSEIGIRLGIPQWVVDQNHV